VQKGSRVGWEWAAMVIRDDIQQPGICTPSCQRYGIGSQRFQDCVY
jgi:hypothetical protein